MGGGLKDEVRRRHTAPRRRPPAALLLPKGNEPLSYDLRGRARHLDLRRLPPQFGVPPAETNVDAGYHVRGIEPVGPVEGPSG